MHLNAVRCIYGRSSLGCSRFTDCKSFSVEARFSLVAIKQKNFLEALFLKPNRWAIMKADDVGLAAILLKS